MFPRFPRRLARIFIPGALAAGLLLLLLGAGNQGSTERELAFINGRLPVSSSSSSRFAAVATDQRRPGVAAAFTTTTTTTAAKRAPSAGGGGGGGGGGAAAAGAAQTLLQRISSATAAGAAVTALAKAGGTIRPEDIVNPHPFSYLINPGEAACRINRGERQGHVWLLVYVHSAPGNLKKRQSIRQTWGQPKVLGEHNATIVFILGAVADAHIQELVLLESERYGDIVQENFTDSYRNLTYKAIAGLRWAATFCSRATYILKTDDDILVNLYAVVKHVRTVVAPQYGAQRLILCNLWNHMKIIRDKKSKWYVSEKELTGEYFPTYCSGSAFLLSGDMAQLMYEASLVTPFFWVDDYYITGALIKHLAVKHRAVNQAYSLNPGVALEKYRKDAKRELFFFHLHNLRLMYGLWMNMTHVHEAEISTSVSLNSSSSSSLASH